MPQQVDSATVIMLDCITDDDIGRKLRIAGRMLTYDAESALVLLHDASHALLVDVSLCIDADVLLSVQSGGAKEERGSNGNTMVTMRDRNVDHRWALERKGYVWVVGYPERVDHDLPIPELPAYLPAPVIDPSIVMRAVLVAPARDLNMVQLRSVLAEMAEVPPTPYPV
ncbi:hypothetical protein F5I97DRAFT_692305 [Phlebopus sp. FC_14]|nr:hypothetical protein F5I97DRAFT_692305 [Phlebopus sp. FC_14]